MNKKRSIKDLLAKMVFGGDNKLAKHPEAIKGNEDASEMGFRVALRDTKRFGLSLSKRRKMIEAKTMFPMMRELRKGRKSYKKNPKESNLKASKEFFKELVEYAETLGISIGFAKLPHEYIFKNEAVLFDNVIVLSMEMDKEKMNKAPSIETGKMVVETYHELGKRTNKIADFLKENGFRAQACHPLGGPINYSPLAMLAGMGWFGRHGLIITPKYGPRHRLSAVLTNITNLPIPEQNEHKWIEEYCATCGRCIEKCPPKAILETPIIQRDGRKTHIDMEKCFPEFGNQYGCSICVKECMFNRVGYEKLKKIVEKR